MSVEGLGRCVMVVPTYNESENIEWIVGRLRAAQPGVDVGGGGLATSMFIVMVEECPSGSPGIDDGRLVYGGVEGMSTAPGSSRQVRVR